MTDGQTDRGMDRGMGRGMNRGMDRGMNRGMGRGVDAWMHGCMDWDLVALASDGWMFTAVQWEAGHHHNDLKHCFLHWFYINEASWIPAVRVFWCSLNRYDHSHARVSIHTLTHSHGGRERMSWRLTNANTAIKFTFRALMTFTKSVQVSQSHQPVRNTEDDDANSLRSNSLICCLLLDDLYNNWLFIYQLQLTTWNLIISWAPLATCLYDSPFL